MMKRLMTRAAMMRCSELRKVEVSGNAGRRGGRAYPLKVRRRLVDEVDISRLAEGHNERHALQFAARQRLHVLVDDVVELHRLDDVCGELRVHKGALDLLDEQHAHRALELGRNRLRLQGDVQLRRLGRARIRLELAG